MTEREDPRYQKDDIVASIGAFQQQGKVSAVRFNRANQCYSYLVRGNNDEVSLFFEPQLVLIEAGQRQERYWEDSQDCYFPLSATRHQQYEQVTPEEIEWFRRYFDSEQANSALQILEDSQGDLAAATKTAAEQAGITIESASEWLFQQSKSVLDVVLEFADRERVGKVITQEDFKEGFPDFITLVTGLIAFKLTAIAPQILIFQFFLLIYAKKVLRHLKDKSADSDAVAEKDEG